MWFAEAEGDIGEINADGTISESGVVAGGIGGVTTGPDGATWFTYWSSTAPHGNIGRLAADGTVTTYPMPPDPETDVIEPGVLVSAADGYMYAQLQGGESYAARISTDGAVTYLKLPSYAWDIVRGPDGAAWFTGRWGICLSRRSHSSGTSAGTVSTAEANWSRWLARKCSCRCNASTSS